MHLKRLELQGFKSFCEKIRLDFNMGITSIVGPNGSGKSNLSDAVKWVLGEQSAKSLRGAKMEDVIFAGTQNRRPMGFAEVSIIIDNSDRKMPIDYSEIKITRKVFRSGESEYQLNGVGCRLKDIYELLMDTGIGREGYSLIGQGRIEEILSSRSEDRRYLFEEAAGIVKFKNRKIETQTRLEREKQNLVRVNDIINVLAEQIEPLKEQAEKAVMYLEKKERLKVVQVNLFLMETANIEQELSDIGNNLENVIIEIERETNRQNELKGQIDGLKLVLLETDTLIKSKSNELTELRVSTEKRENDIKITNEQINNCKSDIKRIEEDILKLEELINIHKEDKEDRRQKLEGLNNELGQKREALVSLEEIFNELNKHMSGGEAQIDKYNAEIIEKVQKVTEAKSERERLKHSYEALEEQKENLIENNSAVEAEIKQCLEIKESAGQKLETLNNLTDKIRKEQEVLEGEKTKISAEIDKAEKRRGEVNRAYHDLVSRHKMLTELEASYEGYYKSVKAILTKSKQEPERFSGICGAVSECAETDKQYETAINIAFGGAVQNVITKTENDAKFAIEYLKKEKWGRVTFLPVTSMKRNGLGSVKQDVLSEKGVIGIAQELIRYDEVYEPVFANLLGKVIIVDNLQNGIDLSKKYNKAYKIVTLDGELLSAGGAITGGSINKEASAVFGRSREIHELKDQISEYEKEVKTHEDLCAKLSEQLKIIINKLQQGNILLHEKALERVSLNESLTRETSRLTTLNNQKKKNDLDDGNIMENLVLTNKRIREWEKLHIQLEKDVEALKESLKQQQNSMSAGKANRDEHINRLTDLKVEIGASEQTALSSEADIKRLDKEISDAYTKIESLKDEISLKGDQIEEKLQNIKEIEINIQQLNDEQAELLVAITQLEEDKKSNSEKLEHLMQAEEDCKNTLYTLQSEKTRLELKNEQAENARRKSYDDMWDEYRLTMQGAISYKQDGFSRENLKSEENRLKQNIFEMGEINVGAIEEYKAVRSRHDEMSLQRDDILEAEEKLNKLIDELTQLMETQFKQQFELISANFSKVFKEMFAGGKAYLKLADEANVLESGIDIVAQPPGKNLQSMSLLSGGERALTAIALLFGILLLKPSPFCIFDEVEAALDDANVVRFNNFLKNFANETQFIIITHRKQTMEAADVLYGVTMQEQGVSKLVSVSFVDQAV